MGYTNGLNIANPHISWDIKGVYLLQIKEVNNMSSSILWAQFENDCKKSKGAIREDKEDLKRELKKKKRIRGAVLYGSQKTVKAKR